MPNKKKVVLGMVIDKAKVMPELLTVASDLTDQQQAFVDAYVAGAKTPTEAATRAGYANGRVSSYRLLRLPHVIAAIRRARMSEIQGEGVKLAWSTIKGLMTDADVPKHVAFQAARYTMEIAGYGVDSKPEGEDKPLSEMTEAELLDFIERKKRALDALPMANAKVIEADPA